MAHWQVFDGHNDTLAFLREQDKLNACTHFLHGGAKGHLDLPRAQLGGMFGGLFALYVDSPLAEGQAHFDPNVEHRMLPQDIALQEVIAQLSLLIQIERASQGEVRICRSVAEIEATKNAGAFACVVHMEGAEALDLDGHCLEVLYRVGLRSLGIVWSRRNAFGDGVKTAFPSSPDTGGGLTQAGIHLVKACHEKKIAVDLSHMDEKGFWQVANLAGAPLIASHSNAHMLCAQSRNLTDAQLDAIRESNGLVGLNFSVGFLRADGQRVADTSLNEMVKHILYLVERLGEDKVALGSDFNGTTVPAQMKDVTGLPLLAEALSKHGVDQTLLDKIGYQNWLRVLKATWGE